MFFRIPSNRLARFLRANRPRVGLSVKLALLLGVSAVLLVSAFGLLASRALDQSVHRTLQDRLVLAQTAARHLDSLLTLIEQTLAESAAQDAWHDPAQVDAALARAYRRVNAFAARLCLLDANAQIVAAYPPLATSPSFEQLASVAAIWRGQPFAVSRYARPLITEQFAPVALVPIRDSESRLQFALLATLDLTSPAVRVFTQPIGLGSTGYMDLIDLGGTILASTRAERIGTRSDHADDLTRLVHARQASVTTCHACHATAAPLPQTEILVFAPLERAAWGVTIRQSEAEVFEATRALQTQLIMLGVFTLALGLLFAWMIQRAVIAPVSALTLGAQRIAAGDLTTPLRVGSRDEIGELARAFDAMRVRLAAWNRELDARVKERTRECETARAEVETLYIELRAKEHARHRLLQRVISTQEDERKRIARELHDTTNQTLIGMMYRLERASELLGRGKVRLAEMRGVLEKLREAVQTARAEVNRVIWDLRPMLLDQLGLVPAVRSYAETRLGETALQWNIRVRGEPRRLAPQSEAALFRVTQEALNNVARHAHAQRVEVTFEYSAQQLVLSIDDDGVGFDPAAVGFSRDGACGLGLLSMEERMNALGGTFVLRSAPGAGTHISLTAPIEETA